MSIYPKFLNFLFILVSFNFYTIIFMGGGEITKKKIVEEHFFPTP